MKSPDPADIIIVGGGLAGLTLSIIMAEKGYRAVVVEERALASKSNRAIVLQANGLNVLDRTGLLSRLPPYTPTTKTVFFNGHRQELGQFNYRLIDHQHNYLLPIIPHEVEQKLAERAQTLGVITKRGYAFTGFAKQSSGVNVKVRNVKGGVEEIQAPVLVGADGANSAVRNQAGIRFAKKKYRDGYLLMLAGKSDLEYGISTYYLDRGMNTGIYPVNREKTYVFYYVPIGAFDRLRDRGLSRFKEHLAGLAPELKDSLGAVESWDDLLYLQPVGVRCETWVADHIALVGDAASAINPNAGQGLNLALEGSASLATVLDDCYHKNDFSRESLLRYETEKRPLTDTFYEWAETAANGLSTESWVRTKLAQRVTRNLAQKPGLTKQFLEFGAGLRPKPPSLLERMKLLIS